MDDRILAWIAVFVAGVALAKAVYDFWHKGRTDRMAIDEALAKSPEVLKQLELGNIGEAVKHLNVIIQNQADHIDRLEVSNQRCLEREEASEVEMAHATARAKRQDARIAELERVLRRALASKTRRDVESDLTFPEEG